MDILILALNIALVICSIGVVVLILAQKTQSGGLGSAFGGETQSFGIRGKAASKEAKLQKLTVILAVAIGVLAIALLIIGRLMPKADADTEALLRLFLK